MSRIQATDAALARRTARLSALIIAHRATVVLLEAPAGFGKSRVLADLSMRTGARVQSAAERPAPRRRGLTLVDARCASPEGLEPERWVEVGARLVVALRPGAVTREMRRALLYGSAERIAADALRVSADDVGESDPEAKKGAARLQASGGWPWLFDRLAHGGADPEDLGAYLRNELLDSLSDAGLVALDALLRGDPIGREDRRALAPLGPLAGPFGFAAPAAEPALRAALRRAMAARPRALEAAAGARLRTGAAEEAVADLLEAGLAERALEVFSRAGGAFFGHMHGPRGLRRLLDRFEAAGLAGRPVVAAARSMQAVKAGQVERARRLLSDAFGGALPALRDTFARGRDWSLDARLMRLTLTTFEDEPVPPEVHDDAAGLLAELDERDHLMRGAVYNALLEAHCRARRLVQAEDVGRRALMHYERAGAPNLAFYVHVHRAMIRLAAGRAASADEMLDRAAEAHAAVPFDAPQDARLLALLRACAAYDRGAPEAMAAFAQDEIETVLYGELWPTIAEFALVYGAAAVQQARGIDAALAYLELWRVQRWRTRRFRGLIEQRAVAALQAANRWRQAGAALDRLPTRIGRTWVETAGNGLADLADRDEIATALLWLRQEAFERPRERSLTARLAAMAENPRITWRQAQAVALWRAFALRRSGRIKEARAEAAAALARAAARDCPGALAEEGAFLGPLLEDRRIALADALEPEAGRMLRRLRRTEDGAPPAMAGLTARERRVLMLLGEGCANKDIARELRVSPPTVKFHLANLYRKLDCARRRDAVAIARARRWLD